MQKIIQDSLRNAGHSALMPVQQESINAIDNHSEVIVYSKTGSGKTMAFLLAMLSKIDPNKKGIQGLILAPSRELSLQVTEVFRSLKTGYKITTCYGGHSIRTEVNSLSETPTVLVGTPGRIADHMDRGNLDDLEHCAFLIIDEFDKCLEFGFEEDMDFITHPLKSIKHKLLASATKLDRIPDYLAMNKAFTVDKLSDDSDIKVKQHIVEYDVDIVHTLTRLVCSFKNELSIIFCNYREVTDDLVSQLKNAGIVCIGYHGGMEQDQRERALLQYRNGSSTILVCTDLGARGLDIPEIKHIVHYQYPGSPEAFTHRQGRTARMSSSGNSYLFKGPETTFPEYIKPDGERLQLKEFYPTPQPKWSTVYFSAGKKDKVNKIDLVGFLFKKGELAKDEIGLITVKDRSSYVAISKNKVQRLLKRIKNEKVKGKKLKIAISK